MATFLRCPKCGREKQVGDEHAGKMGTCPCGERVQAVMEPEEDDEQEHVPFTSKTPWREDNWGIASVALASCSIGLAMSPTGAALCAPAIMFGLAAAICSRNFAIGTVGLLANLGLAVLGFIAITMANG